MPPQPVAAPSGELKRVVGLPGAVMTGLGSIVGTGVFVSLGLAAGVAGPAVIVAIAIATAVAVCNGLSSAQLAAAYPVSGGTYEYGHRVLRPWLGFSAGWMFCCAKSASAATAALGLAGYLLQGMGGGAGLRIGVALAAVAAVTLLVASGLQRSTRANAVVVTVTLASLIGFVVAGAPAVRAEAFAPFWSGGARGLLHAAALMFVAVSGYARIATLGEEVRDPGRTIPRAIVVTLAVTALLYAAVAAVAVGLLGAPGLAAAVHGAAAPLEVAARVSAFPAVRWLVAAGAATAMLGVLLNLVLGLSRVVLAMARRSDLPSGLAHVTDGTPRRAVVAVGAAIGGLVLLGSVETTWSFSAFTVLVYYAITNAAALRMPAEVRRFPRAIAALGLAACLGLAAYLEPAVWLAGGCLLAIGLAWHLGRQRALGQSRRRDARAR
jgi:basic amino acid/polyamine antiporter, APA family